MKIAMKVHLASNSTQLVDRELLRELVEAIGIDDYRLLLDSLSGEVDILTTDLLAKAAANEERGFRSGAHRLAGLLAQFGAIEAATEAERLHHGETGGDLQRLAASLRDLCRASLTTIMDVCATLGQPQQHHVVQFARASA